MTTGENGATALRIAQAKDDQMVHHYAVEVTDTATGAKVVSSKVLSDFYFMPRRTASTFRFPMPQRAPHTKPASKPLTHTATGHR